MDVVPEPVVFPEKNGHGEGSSDGELDDAPIKDPEIEDALKRKKASFVMWASAWFFSRQHFNPSSTRGRERWAKARDGGLYEAFVSTEGRVEDSYYCSDVAAAAAVTLKRRSIWSKLFRWEEPFLHILNNAPEGAEQDRSASAALDLLSECDSLATSAESFLTLQPRRHWVGEIYGLATDALFILDEAARRVRIQIPVVGADGAGREGGSQLVQSARRRWRSLQREVDFAAKRAAQYYFLRGVLLGSLIMVALGWSAGRAFPKPFSREFVAWTVGAGAVGALASVLLRVKRSGLILDYQVGRHRLVLLGALRPLFGGLSGLLVYLAAVAGVIPLTTPVGTPQRLAMYILVSFVAGFNERSVQDMIANVGTRTRLANTTSDESPTRKEQEAAEQSGDG